MPADRRAVAPRAVVTPGRRTRRGSSEQCYEGVSRKRRENPCPWACPSGPAVLATACANGTACRRRPRARYPEAVRQLVCHAHILLVRAVAHVMACHALEGT